MRFSDSAMELLVLHSWPGNVRQLGNEVRRLAALLDSAAYVTPDQLSKKNVWRQESELTPPVSVYPQIAVRLDQESGAGKGASRARNDRTSPQK